MEKVYVITGGCGYVGYSVVKKLANENAKIKVLAIPSEDSSMVKALGAEIFIGDVRKKETIEPLFADKDAEYVIIHIAGIVTVETAFNQFVWDVNVEGTKNMLELAKEHKAKSFVYLGSVDAIPPVKDKVYSDYDKFNPDDVVTIYAKTKAVAINEVKKAAEEGLNACCVLPTAVFGPDDYANGMVSKMLASYAKGNVALPLIEGGYDFVDVRDLADGIIAATTKGRPGEIYILCGKYVSVFDFINEVRAYRNLSPAKIKLPNAVSKTVGFFAENLSKFTKKPPVFTPYTIDCINSGVLYSPEKAEKELGYKCRPRSESIKDMIDFMEKENRL